MLKAWDRHDRLTAITALALTPKRQRCKLYFQLLRHNATGDDFFWFLVNLHHEIKRDLIVVWDRLSGHRKAVRYFSELNCRWLQFEYLPPYCPDLDPVEHVWATTKWGRLANWPAPDIDELEVRVAEDLRNQSHETHLLKGHFRWAGLGLD